MKKHTITIEEQKEKKEKTKKQKNCIIRFDAENT